MSNASTTRRRWGLALAALLGLGAMPAEAQEAWPTRPIRLVVPYAPGGGTDVVARVLAQTMTDQLPHAVLVENRTGAGGGIGAEAVARSTPRTAHTFLFTNNGYSGAAHARSESEPRLLHRPDADHHRQRGADDHDGRRTAYRRRRCRSSWRWSAPTPAASITAAPAPVAPTG